MLLQHQLAAKFLGGKKKKKKVPSLCFSDTAERKEQQAENDQHRNELIISQRRG